MNDMTHRHYDICQPIGNDDARQFYFVRSSGLPLDYFPRERSYRLVWLASAVLAVVLMVAAWT